MAITLNGTTGITTPDVTSDSYTGALAVNASAPDNSLVVNSSGNVGIGTSSPNRLLDIATSNAGGSTLVSLVSATDGNCQLLFGDTASDTQGKVLYNNSGDYMAFNTADAERARIDSSGNLLVGTTSPAGNASTFKSSLGAGQQAVSFWNNATSGTRYFVTFGTEASYTERGYITWNGSTMALSNASDERLKENIVDAPSALPKIEAMQIRSFDFKADGRHVDYGVIAQELNQVIPESVFEGIDKEDGSIDKPWSVGLEPIIPVLIKAVQEQQALITAQQTAIETLEARVAALEAA